MTNINPTPESPQYKQEHWLAIENMSMVQDILMDEDPDVERPDLWRLTWNELQIDSAEYMDHSEEISRQIARTQIRSLYMESLECQYPQLKTVESEEELIIEMAMIADLPPCDGSFTASEYQSADGKMRGMSCTEVKLGDSVALSICLIDHDNGLTKSYILTIGVDGKMWGGADTEMSMRDADEDEMLSKIHPSQISNLVQVLHGSLMPYELENKLVEIETMSAETDEFELRAILEYARMQYYLAAQTHAEEAQKGVYEIQLDYLNEMHQIALERMEQLLY